MAEYNNGEFLEKKKKEEKEDIWSVVETRQEKGETYISITDVTRKGLNPEYLQKYREQKKRKAAKAGVQLKKDPQIVPLAKQNQLNRKKIFDKTRFLDDVKAMNKKAREPDQDRLTEKSMLWINVKRLSRLKVWDAEKNVTRSLPGDIREVLKELEEYGNMDVVGKKSFSGIINKLMNWAGFSYIRGNVDKEYTSLRNADRKLQQVIDKYGKVTGYKSVVSKLKSLRKSMNVQMGLIPGSYQSRQDRMKAKWKDFRETDKQIVGLNKTIRATTDSKEKETQGLDIRDRKDWPLFAHRPTYEDVLQGNGGNCFFLTALATLSSNEIRDMMLDNGDGTATVRFFQMNEKTKKYEPVYVTVDKVVNIRSSKAYLWVQVMEKAYAQFLQSNSKNVMHFTERKEYDAEKRKKVRAKDKIIDENDIDLGFVCNGGFSYQVLGALLGREEEITYVYRGGAEKKHSQILKEALQHSDEKGSAVLRIQYLQQRMEHLKKSTAGNLKSKGIYIWNVDHIKDDIINEKTALQIFQDELKKAKEKNDQILIQDYTKKIETKKKGIEEREKELAPIRRLMNDYWDEEEKYKKEINDIRKEHKIRTGYNIRTIKGKKYIQDPSAKGAYIPYEGDTYGMKDELERGAQRIKETTISKGEDAAKKLMQKGRVLLAALPEKFMEGFEKETHLLKSTTISGYQDYLEAALKSVRKRDAVFKKLIADQGIAATVMNNVQTAESICAEFLTDIINKMKNNIKYIDGVKREATVGMEDSNAIGYFEQLERKLQEGQKVCIGLAETESDEGYGVAGETKTEGMVGTHAYTVMDTAISKSGARMVKLRNPWGHYVPSYAVSSGEFKASGNNSLDTGGIFWVEINHLMKYMDMIYGSGKSEEAQK